MDIILDASPLIAFYVELKAPEKITALKRVGNNLLIPHAVLYRELIGEASDAIKRDLRFFIVLEPVKVEDLKIRFPGLHEGELEVVKWGCIMKEQKKEYMCILDDKNARKAASKLGLNYRGTIGLLHLMNDSGLISGEEMRELCLKLVKRGFYFPEELCYKS